MDLKKVSDELIGHAADLLENDTTHEQIVLVKTVSGAVYHCMNCCTGIRVGYDRDETAENGLLDELRREGDTEVCAVLAVWNGNVLDGEHAVEMPSFHILKGLLELDLRNANAIILADGIHNRTIGESMPPKKDE